MLNPIQNGPQPLLAGGPDEEPLPHGITHQVEVLLAVDGSMMTTHRIHGNFIKRDVYAPQRASQALRNIIEHGWSVTSLSNTSKYSLV